MDFVPTNYNRHFYIVDELFKCTRRYEEETGTTLLGILDNLDEVGTLGFASYTWLNFRNGYDELRGGFERSGVFLSTAVCHHLKIYYNIKLSQRPDVIHEKCGRPLLDCALRPHGRDHDRPFEVDVDILELLLRSGPDPNQGWHGSTVWGWWLEFMGWYSNIESPAPKECARATELLIAYGAHTSVMMPHSRELRHEDVFGLMEGIFGTEISCRFIKTLKEGKLRGSVSKFRRFFKRQDKLP